MRSALAALLLMSVGCRAVERAAVESNRATAAATSETAAGDQSPADPSIDRFDQRIQEHLRHRQAWHRRLLARPDLDAERRAEVNGELAMLYHAYDLRDAARALYEEAALLAPEDPRWPHYLAHVHRADNQLERAVTAFRRVLEIDPSASPAQVRLAEVLLDLDRPAPAESELLSAVARDPSLAVAHFLLGQIAAAGGDPERAVEHWKRCLELQPEADAVRTPLGLAYRDLGLEEEARSQLQAAGSSEVTLVDPWMQRLRGLTESFWRELSAAIEAVGNGEHDAGREALARAVAADPLAPEPRLLLGQLLVEGGDIEEGARQLELVVFLSDRAGAAHLLLSQLKRRQGDLSRAIEELRLAVADEPGSGRFRYQLGDALLAAGRHESAAVELRRAHELIGAESAMPLLLEATAHLAGDRCDVARARIEEGLRSHPERGLWRHALARLLAGCPDAAARDGGRALELAMGLFAAAPSPGHAEAVSMAMAELGDLAAAMQWQRRAVTMTGEGQEEIAELLRRDLPLLESGRTAREPWRYDELALFQVRGGP